MKQNNTAVQEHSARPEFRCRQQFPHQPAPQSAMRSLRADCRYKCSSRFRRIVLPCRLLILQQQRHRSAQHNYQDSWR